MGKKQQHSQGLVPTWPKFKDIGELTSCYCYFSNQLASRDSRSDMNLAYYNHSTTVTVLLVLGSTLLS